MVASNAGSEIREPYKFAEVMSRMSYIFDHWFSLYGMLLLSREEHLSYNPSSPFALAEGLILIIIDEDSDLDGSYVSDDIVFTPHNLLSSPYKYNGV